MSPTVWDTAGWEEKDRWCTDENAVFRCDSDKNSLVIICLYLKVHFLKIC